MKFYENLFPLSRDSVDASDNMWNEQILYDDVPCDTQPVPEPEPHIAVDSSLVEPELEHDDDDKLSESNQPHRILSIVYDILEE